MKFEIETTNIFDKWFKKLKNAKDRARIMIRFDRIKSGNFGDHKIIQDQLFELRFFFGPGYRIYYTIKDGKVVCLLCGGEKSNQPKDIEKAKSIMEELP
ncbi:MAG: type II toxin-antitoxin system RelE/ParE family toxin [Desulfamplus sp.]|nr:type II toxin-antitoxin system RelE/ParE family toxin [Desulfamplus sp.]